MGERGSHNPCVSASRGQHQVGLWYSHACITCRCALLGVGLQGQVGGFLNFTLINEVNKGAAQITALGTLCTATDTGGEMGNWRHICWGQHISRHQLV